MPFHSEQKLEVTLSFFEEELVLSIFPKGAIIQDARFFDNYNLPCPVKVQVELPDGKLETVVLRKTRHGEVGKETELLKVLFELGLPVPEVLKESDVNLGDQEERVSVLSLLSGDNLQKLSMGTQEELQNAKRLLGEGIKQLQEITGKISKEAIAKELPQENLIDQLKEAQKPEKPWSAEPVFLEAIKRLDSVLEKIKTPLVFTNGDYQPANFLTDGEKVTGFVDFESAGFQDPLIGLAKFPIYDLHPINKAGFVDDYLKATGFTKKDFAPRLALGCLMTLQKEISVMGGTEDDKKYRERVLSLLKEALELIK